MCFCMLNICCRYAFQHGLKFNANKAQLICFCKSKFCSTILLNDTILEYSDEVKHLGHILSYNLDDNADIVRGHEQYGKFNYLFIPFC